MCRTQVFWMTRLVVAPWAYHVLHRSFGVVWLLLGLPLMALLVALDLALTGVGGACQPRARAHARYRDA